MSDPRLLDAATRAELLRRAGELEREGVGPPFSMAVAAWQLGDEHGARGRDGLLRVAAVARRLGVGEDLVRRLIEEGALPAARFGRVLRVSPGEVDALVARGGARLAGEGDEER